MAAKKKDAPKRVMKRLHVVLTDSEKLERTTALLEAMSHKDLLIAEKSLATAEANAAIKTAQKSVRELQQALTDGKELREVECLEVHDFARNAVIRQRADTREGVEERAMSLDERQATLPGVEPTKPKAGPGAVIASLGEIVEAKASGKGGKKGARCAAAIEGDRCVLDVGHKGPHALESLDAPWTEGPNPVPLAAKKASKKR